MTRNVCKLTSRLFVSVGFGGVEGGVLFIIGLPSFYFVCVKSLFNLWIGIV
ncbi:hypothetical protein bcere0016_7880 [Bacillus cereus 95/8201]|nr:Hypothetical Protein H9401_0804 [Bacillus anthracis str. H9401]AHK36987.1 hypothetical protein BAPAT_0811 [Bacillus anthracis str. SVA11]EEL18654.1 hypothetical protein bcere0016_7880 [Bacillus cereus 95/8201]EEL47234.1 hypothetical protein bcere0021_7410 [Bacillus cereus Rock3-42]BAR78385.1 hypothetical protein BASH2_04978 [Bacillus anthracis]